MEEDTRNLEGVTRSVLDANMGALRDLLGCPNCYYTVRAVNPTGSRVEQVIVFFYESQWKSLGQFSISLMPSCGWVLIFHNVEVAYDKRGKGVGGFLHRVRLDIARQVRATLVLATVATTNHRERVILEKNGWRELKTFDRLMEYPQAEREKDVVSLWAREVEE